MLPQCAAAATHVTGTYSLGANPRVMATVGGQPQYGLVFAQRSRLITYQNVQYGAQVISGYLDAQGRLNDGAGNLWLDLIPNAGATPEGTYYVVTFNIQGQVHAEIWVVPDVATVTVEEVRQAQAPAAPAPALFYQFLQANGDELPQRQKWNLIGTGVTCVDNAGLLRTDCTFAGGGGGGSPPIASPTVSGTVKIDAASADPVVYLKSSADTLLASKADATHAHAESDVTNLVSDLAGKVPTSRTISTSSPLSGGGALTSDLTLSCPTCEVTGNKNQAGGYAGLDSSSKIAGLQISEVISSGDLTDFTGKSGSGTTAIGATITAPAPDQCLVWSGSNWVNGSCAAGGGGITSLNSQTGSTQTFSKVDDTNVTLTITSATNNHEFALGWTGALAKARQHAATVYTDQANTFGAFLQAFQADTNFELRDPTDTTKRAQFSLSGIPTATTRTVTVAGGGDSVTVVPQTCTGTDKVSAISSAGVVTCSADQGGAGSGDNISVNGVAATDADFDDSTPAAPANAINVKWQKDALTPNNISAYLPYTAPLTVTAGNLDCVTATGSVKGCLSSTDWTTFNNSVDSVSGTANQIVSTGGQTPVLSLADPLTLPGNLIGTQKANGNTFLQATRFTDTSPTGNFIDLRNAAGTTVWKVDVTGAQTSGSSTDPGSLTLGGAGSTAASTATLYGGDAASNAEPPYIKLVPSPAGTGTPSYLFPSATAGKLGISTSAPSASPTAAQTILLGADMFGSSPGTKLATTSLGADPTTNNCVTWVAGGQLGDAGAACGSGGGGDNISVNGTAASDADFDDATPAAPSNKYNVKWQKDALTPNNISAYVDPTLFTAPIWGAGSGFTWTFDAGVTDPTLTFGSDIVTLAGKFKTTKDLVASTDGSSTSSPRIMAFEDLTTGEATRFQFGAPEAIVQVSYGGRMHMDNYWGIEFRGSHQTLGARPFVTGASTDPNVSIINEQNVVNLYVKGKASQTEDLQRWVNSSDTTLAKVDSSGNLTSPTINATTALQTNGTTRINSSGVANNISYDAEGTGNTLSVPVKFWLSAAGCNNATAAPSFDLPTSNAPTAACYGTSPQRFGALDFADGASALTSTFHVTLPADWTATGGVDLKYIWFSGSTSTNSVVWTAQTVCVADGEDLLAPTFNAAQTVADANNATANTRNSASITGVTTTGCAAGETMYFRVGRDPTNASDTLAATASLLGVELTLRRAM
jgi:hypothetical protein